VFKLQCSAVRCAVVCVSMLLGFCCCQGHVGLLAVSTLPWHKQPLVPDITFFTML
jgi:hypothetical protein